jgi:hypothetical protein
VASHEARRGAGEPHPKPWFGPEAEIACHPTTLKACSTGSGLVIGHSHIADLEVAPGGLVDQEAQNNPSCGPELALSP